jgi:membrane-associated PAP2 superfamily phosphatase
MPLRVHPLWRDLAPALPGVAVLAALQLCGADLAITQRLAAPHGFALRDQWLLQHVFHDGLQVGLVFAMAAGCADRWWRLPLGGGVLDGLRRHRGWVLATWTLCVASVVLLRYWSPRSCPWDMAAFGGVAHYVLPTGPADGGPGRCFPSSHAALAFAMFPLYFASRAVSRTHGRAALRGVLACGVLMSVTQIARGAHFASDTLASAVICWVLSAVSWHVAAAWRHTPGRHWRASGAGRT